MTKMHGINNVKFVICFIRLFLWNLERLRRSPEYLHNQSSSPSDQYSNLEPLEREAKHVSHLSATDSAFA
jgi:hypothetical protein